MDAPRKAEPAELIRRLAIKQVQDGDLPWEVAEQLGVSERSVWRWLNRSRADGDESLATARRTGRLPKMNPCVTKVVFESIKRSPCEFGFASERWTAPRLARVLLRDQKVQVNHPYLSDWLGWHGITPQLPECVPRERNEQAIAAWARMQWPLIQQEVSDLHGNLGFSDESGFLLRPLVQNLGAAGTDSTAGASSTTSRQSLGSCRIDAHSDPRPRRFTLPDLSEQLRHRRKICGLPSRIGAASHPWPAGACSRSGIDTQRPVSKTTQ